ncbi:MAG: hypothetical protein JSR60_14105 [Proteobacteria bacterium]|nr:hypothetical protein [Pseudomonadota bacterium]
MALSRSLLTIALLLAPAAASAANVNSDFTLEQRRAQTLALEGGQRAAFQCLRGVSLHGKPVFLDLEYDGAAGRIAVTGIEWPEVTPEVADCIKAGYAAQTGPKFDGPPRTESTAFWRRQSATGS